MNYQPQRFNILPPVIKNLLILNGIWLLALFVFNNTFGIDLNALLGLYFPASEHFQPYQIITHMFMHGGMPHLFFNMFALWMFGAPLENMWGSKRFLIYYFVCGLGAAALHTGVLAYEYYSIIDQVSPDMMATIQSEGLSVLHSNQNYSDSVLAKMNELINMPTVGASGAVFGILLGFGMMFPNQHIYLYFLLPVKAKYFVIAYGLLELWNGLSTAQSNIAHFAHVGGMVFGYFLIRYWKRKAMSRY